MLLVKITYVYIRIRTHNNMKSYDCVSLSYVIKNIILCYVRMEDEKIFTTTITNYNLTLNIT